MRLLTQCLIQQDHHFLNCRVIRNAVPARFNNVANLRHLFHHERAIRLFTTKLANAKIANSRMAHTACCAA
jgi:hypothetical protein